MFVKFVLPFFSVHFDEWKDDILEKITGIQACTRSLQNVSSWGKRMNEPSLIKESPRLKKVSASIISWHGEGNRRSRTKPKPGGERGLYDILI